jgi:hypothetical protein
MEGDRITLVEGELEVIKHSIEDLHLSDSEYSQE